MKPSVAILNKRFRSAKVLAKFFEVGTDTFNRVSIEALVDWARQIRLPGYKITTNQHNYLIGTVFEL